MKDENVLIVPVPSLVATFLNHERAKGIPLTKPEVLSIRDNCPCIAMTADQAKQIEKTRGYVDLDPEYAWEQWQDVRQEFDEAET